MGSSAGGPSGHLLEGAGPHSPAHDVYQQLGILPAGHWPVQHQLHPQVICGAEPHIFAMSVRACRMQYGTLTPWRMGALNCA